MQRRATFIAIIFGIHAFLGLVFFLIPFTAKIYALAIVIFGAFWIINSNNQDQQVLYVSAYIVGAEVLLRMFGASFINEYGKYSIMIMAALGIMLSGTKPKALLMLVFIGLLIPGIFIGIANLSFEVEIRKAIAFNISGPACLAIFSMYTYGRTISMEQMRKTLFFLGLPLLIVLMILILRVPTVKEVVTGTDSNFATSGGFGPNQVSTMLGLGMFLFFTMFLLDQSSKKLTIVYVALTTLFAYRGLVTFSRGGMITGLVMIVVLMLVLFKKLNPVAKSRMLFIASGFALLGLGVWSYTTVQTSGLIVNRYANQDAAGREKEDRLGGRETISKVEIQMFLDNPITGVGVGVNKQYREQTTGIAAASHNEFTRMLAEHGLAGIFMIIFLFMLPILHSFEAKQHIFLWCFFLFWLFTINHAAMRLAAPAFVYALSLLNVVFNPVRTNN